MQSEDQAAFANSSDLKALQGEADALIANILLNQIANEKIQNRTVSIAEKALLNGNNQGRLKTWTRKKIVGFLPKLFQALKREILL